MKRFFKMTKMKYGKLFSKLAALSVVSVLTVVAACAEEAGTGGVVTMDTTAITNALSTGLQSVVSQSISLLSMMLPFAVSFFGIKWLCTKAMGWFKGMAK